jgi:hypothetical protein
MDKNESPGSVVTSINDKQKREILGNLFERGLFFTWEQLQVFILKLGPKAKITDIQKAIKERNNSG